MLRADRASLGKDDVSVALAAANADGDAVEVVVLEETVPDARRNANAHAGRREPCEHPLSQSGHHYLVDTYARVGEGPDEVWSCDDKTLYPPFLTPSD